MILKAIVKQETPDYKQYYGEIDPQTTEMKTLGKIPCPAYLEIVEEIERGVPYYLLLYYDKDGGFLTESYCQTVEQAKGLARLEFNISEDEWESIE